LRCTEHTAQISSGFVQVYSVHASSNSPGPQGPLGFRCRSGCRLYCDMEPPAHLMQYFDVRGDGQIMGLELLSIALGKSASLHGSLVAMHAPFCPGISTFKEEIRGCNLVVWSDNTGAEHATNRGECCAVACVCAFLPTFCLSPWQEALAPSTRIVSYIACGSGFSSSICRSGLRECLLKSILLMTPAGQLC